MTLRPTIQGRLLERLVKAASTIWPRACRRTLRNSILTNWSARSGRAELSEPGAVGGADQRAWRCPRGVSIKALVVGG